MNKLAFVFAVACFLGACGDNESTRTAGSGGGGGSGGGMNEPDCYENPKTHHEIINACTKSVKVTKTPKLDLTLPEP